jgi:hypothetical protein
MLYVPRTEERASRRSLLFLFVALLVGVGAGVGLGAGIWAGSSHIVDSSVRTAAPGDALFVIDADSGSATRVGTNSWRVDLTRPTVLWFFDRPERGSGFETARVLVEGWAATFHGASPYGAILAPSGPSGHHPTAVGVGTPTFSAAQDELRFTVTPDRGESTRDAAWFSDFTPQHAVHNGRVVLFIDNGNLLCPSPDAGAGVTALSCFPASDGGSGPFRTGLDNQGLPYEAVACTYPGEPNCVDGGQCPTGFEIDLGISPPMCVTSILDPKAGKEVPPS